MRFSSCSSLTRSSMSVVQVQQVRVQSVRRQSSSHICLQPAEHGQGCCMTDAGLVVDVLLAQFIDGYGRPCDHAATLGVATVEVPQIQFIARVSGHSSSQQRGYSGGDEGFFGFCLSHFRAPLGCLELSASFRGPRWRIVLCHRGLLHNFILSTCRHRHSA